MRKTLREINTEILELSEELVDAIDDAERTAIIEAIDALAIKRNEKLESIAHVRIQQKSDVIAIDAEIKRLCRRKQAIENAGKSLDIYTLTEMKTAGIKRYQGKLASITVAKSTMAAIVLNESDIPEPFIEVKTERIIKKADAIRYHKESGNPVAGFKFHQGEHLRIK